MHKTQLSQTAHQGRRALNRLAIIALVGTAAAAAGCSSDDDKSKSTEANTYYQQALPIFEQHCLGCHQPGGIGQFSLADYQTAKVRAADIQAQTAARTMPPWGAKSDGSCGEFAGSLALTDEEIATLAAWAQAGAPEGTKREAVLPELPTLTDATSLKTPKFTPEAQGTALAENDEYRCFLFDAPKAGYITGYNVVPGNDKIVHHMLAMVVDPDAPSELQDGTTNLDQIQALDAQSPDRDGWPCFGMAGENVNASSVPVVWAPGQGVVNYPNDSGVPVRATDKIVIQIHYNLADPSTRGQQDQSELQLRIADDVPNVGVFVLDDPLLSSLFSDNPDTLKGGQASVKYTWKNSLRDFGLGDISQLSLYGIMPHMHQRGRKYTFDLGQGSSANTCATQVDDWDFHWQRMYFFEQPYQLTPDSPLQVTCDYDTSDSTEDVLPGWGTQNEMCLATLYLTVPKSALGGN